MKAIAFVCAALFALTTVLLADDFKTLDGKEYKGVTVSRVDPDGISIETDAGVEKIPFSNLPEDVQKKYGYDSAKAAQDSEKEAQREKAEHDAEIERKKQEQLDPLDKLANELPAKIDPNGELSKTFDLNPFSNYTDVQRENAEKEITGKVVQWTLTVFDVSRTDVLHCYKIQTGGTGVVGTFTFLYSRNEDERAFIEGLKRGDKITIKGKITGTTYRNINLDPAILVR